MLSRKSKEAILHGLVAEMLLDDRKKANSSTPISPPSSSRMKTLFTLVQIKEIARGVASHGK